MFKINIVPHLEYDLYKGYAILRFSYNLNNSFGIGFGSTFLSYQISIGTIVSSTRNVRWGFSFTVNFDSKGGGPFALPKAIQQEILDKEIKLFVKGIDAYQNRNYKIAYDLFTKALDINPKHKLAKEYQKRALIHLKSINWLDEEQRKLIKFHRKIALKYEKQDKIQNAIQEWYRIIQIDPANEEALKKKNALVQKVQDIIQRTNKEALNDYKNNLKTQALEKFISILKYTPDDKKIKNWIEKIQGELSEKEKKEITSLTKQNQANQLYTEALTAIGNKKFKTAISKLEKAVVLDSSNDLFHKYLKIAKNEYEIASKNLRGLAGANKLISKGILDYNQDLFYDALRAFELAETAYPQLKETKDEIDAEIKSLVKSADLKFKAGEYQAAMQNYKEAQILDKQNTDILQKIDKIQLLLTYVKKGDQYYRNIKTRPLSINEYNEVLALNPYDKGLEAIKIKNWASAIDYFEKVIEVYPKYEDTQELLSKSRINRIKQKERTNKERIKQATSKGTIAPNSKYSQLLNEGIKKYRVGQAIQTWRRIPRIASEYSKAQSYIRRAKFKK